MLLYLVVCIKSSGLLPKLATHWTRPHFYPGGNRGNELRRPPLKVVPRQSVGGQVPFLEAQYDSPSWCVYDSSTAQKVISHVSMSFLEYVHLIFWEEQAAGVKVRQEIFLEALKPFRFWRVPSNSHRVEPLKLPCGDWTESGAASACTCPASFLGDPRRGTKRCPREEVGKMN